MPKIHDRREANRGLMYSETQLPLNPVGYFMLVEERKAEIVSDGGILLPSETQEAQQYLNMFGTVVAMGESCYRHKEFNNIPWCQVGDLIMFHKHTGMRVDRKKRGRPAKDRVRYRLMKDNDVLAVVTDPDEIEVAVY
jgi:co-chaperonin GroES (HSP10)